MFWNKVKRGVVVGLLAVLVAGAGGLGYHGLAGEGQPTPKADPRLEVAAPAEPQAIKQPTERDRALVKAAQDQYEARFKEYVSGKTTMDFALPWSEKLLKAQLRLSERKADRVAAYKGHLKRLLDLEDQAKQRVDAGSTAASQYYQVLYHRIEAEIWLDEVQGKN